MAIGLTARAVPAAGVLDRGRLVRWADGLAIALAVSLPWSTSATGVLAGLWLLALIPTLDREALRRVLVTPAGGLPVLLWVFGAVGMAWADVPWLERLEGLGPYHKLLCIPLLMAQFERSDRASWVMVGFLASCTALLALSFALVVFPALPWLPTKMPGVPVKNYATQSELFSICAFLLVERARMNWLEARRSAALLKAALAVAFIINILVIATTRTALVVLPILAVLFALRAFGRRGAALGLAAVALIGAVAWFASPFLQYRVGTLSTEVESYSAENARSSAGERLEFWKKSLVFIAEAPVIGHGTGSITENFRRAAAGQTGVAAVVADNPHNQVLAVAIQLGTIGALCVLALWIAHLLLFRGMTLAAWIGTVIVVQNMIGSLFNSQLFDFTHGWAYVIGVGVCGGTMLARAAAKPVPRGD